MDYVVPSLEIRRVKANRNGQSLRNDIIFRKVNGRKAGLMFIVAAKTDLHRVTPRPLLP